MQAVIEFLNTQSPFLVWGIQFFTCYITILLIFRFFGKHGLYIYLVVAVIASNIQVLKLVDFSFFPDPLALGTTLFTSTFLCTDILYEAYGAKAAQKGVLLGFVGFLFFTFIMILTLGFKPLHDATDNLSWALETQDHLLAVFLPMPSFFVAGMISYLASQYLDIYIYDILFKAFKGQYIWIRNNIATITSCFIDSFIFSFLAFYVLGPHQMPLKTILLTYVLGTFSVRSFIALLDTPFLYASLKFKPKNKQDHIQE